MQSLAEDCDNDCLLAKLPPSALKLVAEFFKVLSEASRLQIVCALRNGPKNVTQIIEMTGLGQANVSKHLKMLAQAGIVSRDQQGVCVFYTIANPFVFELCELVCNFLSIQIQQQAEQIKVLDAFRQGEE
ncbi:MAG: winged helix-turn-helix transcriptional regulator [Leptolyngbyaceae cyanobacterium T60_A2020_046]|nr:winged helix-turn-helix transcriptional regulator [Leptolyngbyaceae cyanobacterium T60_A2020_046]